MCTLYTVMSVSKGNQVICDDCSTLPKHHVEQTETGTRRLYDYLPWGFFFTQTQEIHLNIICFLFQYEDIFLGLWTPGM